MGNFRRGWIHRVIPCVVGAVALAVCSGSADAQQCGGDINHDGRVDSSDLAVVLAEWGDCPTVVTSVSPQTGSTLGGTLITINGFNLGESTGVSIGGAPCTGLQVISPTLLRAVSPAGALGEAAVIVNSPTGTATAPAPFTYVLQAITSVTPAFGTTAGGTAITIFGSYLGGATGVTLDGVAATNVLSLSATAVSCVTPAGTVGLADVAVTTPKGTAVAAGLFTYIPGWCTPIEMLPHPLVVVSQSLREAIIATGLPWRVRDNLTQIEMVLVPPGSFNMGCIVPPVGGGCLTDEQPVHPVTLTNAFYIGRYEVTQSQWTPIMVFNPSSFQGLSDSANRPVEQVGWGMIQSFLSATSMRLPTEAEWEYACRAGTTTAYHGSPQFPSGTNYPDSALLLGWISSNAGNQTHAVGLKAANSLGIHDMSGNVGEWLADWWGYYSAGAQTNPTGPPTGDYFHVVRGSGWTDTGLGMRVSRRGSIASYQAWADLGFRVARNP